MTTIDVERLLPQVKHRPRMVGYACYSFAEVEHAVRAAIEQYVAERVAEMQANFDRTCLDLQNYAEPLTAERDALQADAERYRWLRDMDEDPICSLAAMWTDCKGSAHSISKRVDAAVDAHRGKNTT